MPSSNESQARAPTVVIAKAEGAFLALAAGDALGWPQEIRWKTRGNPAMESVQVEFKEWTRRSGGRFHPYEEVIRPGEYSDDTQLTLAVARSRANHGSEWWKAFVRTELPLWTLYERGGGGATKRAANAWVRGHAPWKSRKKESVRQYFAAGGNGVAMRVLPHALFLAGEETPAALMHDVVLDGSATHGHPRALVGAAVYAHAAWFLIRRRGTLRFGELLDSLIDDASGWSAFPRPNREKGTWFEAADQTTRGYELIWNQTVREMRELLETARKGIRAGALADDHAILEDLGCFGRTKGAGTSSAAAATYLAARHAAQPRQAILRAAFEEGADTDTLAAMAGGLVGCLAGIEWIPEPWLRVQDAGYLRRIASRLARGPDGADQRPVKPLADPRSVFSQLVSTVGQEMILSGSIRVRATVLPDPKPIAKSIKVRAWRLNTTDGQTMYVTKVNRMSNGSCADRRADGGRVTQRENSPPMSMRVEAGPGLDAKQSLYREFQRQWQNNFGPREMTRRDVETALGLVRSQVNKWLELAEQDGWIKRTSKNPAKYALSDHQQSLL